ncbi:MAG: branched-chain amino acid ABC transporter permease, partial [Lachnospiraceae bacterium]|nr:branched-chain amino acid ABC transporter permease [Lachnospiraceae bacterium]
GVILILITLFIVLNLINSRDGRAIMAIRDNRIAAESIGINITKYKLMAFTVSAALAGVAGALYSHNLSTLQASKFNFNTSILALVFVVLGGIGNMRGSIIAAVVLTVLPEMLRFLSDYRMLIYAIVLIAMMLINWAPKALEWRERILGRFFHKSAKEGE